MREIKDRVKAKDDAEFKAMLQSQGLSEGGMRRQFERNFMMIEYVRNIIYPKANSISLQQVRDYYEQHPDEFKTQDQVKWQDIFIDASRFQTPAAARQYAEQVRGRAAKVDFVQLVQQFDQGTAGCERAKGSAISTARFFRSKSMRPYGHSSQAKSARWSISGLDSTSFALPSGSILA